jgi:hypothetical protein
LTAYELVQTNSKLIVPTQKQSLTHRDLHKREEAIKFKMDQTLKLWIDDQKIQCEELMLKGYGISAHREVILEECCPLLSDLRTTIKASSAYLVGAGIIFPEASSAGYISQLMSYQAC